MGKKLQQVGLVALGAALGIAASLHFSAMADRQASALQLPVDDLPRSPLSSMALAHSRYFASCKTS